MRQPLVVLPLPEGFGGKKSLRVVLESMELFELDFTGFSLARDLAGAGLLAAAWLWLALRGLRQAPRHPLLPGLALVAGAVLLWRARVALSVLCTAADEDDRDTLRGFGQKAADVRAALASLSCGGDAPPDATAALAEAFGWAVETGTGARMTEERAADLARRWIEGEGR